MTEIRFYHLQTQSLEQALPSILNKALAGGRKIVIRFGGENDVEHFNESLWVYAPDSFLPHGSKADGNTAQQPIYLTAANENPNKADMMVLCNHHTVPENTPEFSLCCDFIDGNDQESVEAGRTRWNAYKQSGYSVTYWQQTEKGGWEQKA